MCTAVCCGDEMKDNEVVTV